MNIFLIMSNCASLLLWHHKPSGVAESYLHFLLLSVVLGHTNYADPVSTFSQGRKKSGRQAALQIAVAVDAHSTLLFPLQGRSYEPR